MNLLFMSFNFRILIEGLSELLAAMGQGGTQLKQYFFTLCLALVATTDVWAQNGACASDSTIVITFPELDPPIVPPFNDPTYTQAIFTSGLEPLSVVIDFDPQDTTNPFKFPDYFTHQWNSVTNEYTVRMIKGINRDGNSSSTSDDVNILQYKVSCTDTLGSYNVEFRILKIQILDVNDNSPYFINAPYTVRVNELTPVGVTVFRGILADDLDEGPNKQITYILTPGYSMNNFNGTQFFYLPSDQEGILSVSSPLDFESMYRLTGNASETFFNITVIARDNAVPASTQRSSLTTLRVIITDGDDQGPEFVYPSCIQSSQPYSKSCVRPRYLTSISSSNASEVNLQFRPDPPEVSDPTRTVYILMQDRDTLNSAVTCTIRTTPAGYESFFTVRSNFYQGKQYKCEIVKVSGKIINRTDVSQLEIIVEAIEQSANLRVDYATVILTVVDGSSNQTVNKTACACGNNQTTNKTAGESSNNQTTNKPVNVYPPSITSNGNNGYISENSPIGSRVFIDQSLTSLLKLTFADPYVSSTETLVQLNVTVRPVSPFTVTQDGYIVLTAASLDYETVTRYNVTVIITEPSLQKYSANTTIFINVINMNDNSPVVLSPENHFVTLEPAICNMSRNIVTVQATDVDFGPPQYALSRVIPDTATSRFTVSLTGTVSFVGSLTPGEVYVVYVTVSDHGIPVRSTETFVIISVPQAPTCKSTPRKYLIYVSEDDTINATIFFPTNGQPLPFP